MFKPGAVRVEINGQIFYADEDGSIDLPINLKAHAIAKGFVAFRPPPQPQVAAAQPSKSLVEEPPAETAQVAEPPQAEEPMPAEPTPEAEPQQADVPKTDEPQPDAPAGRRRKGN